MPGLACAPQEATVGVLPRAPQLEWHTAPSVCVGHARGVLGEKVGKCPFMKRFPVGKAELVRVGWVPLGAPCGRSQAPRPWGLEGG